MSSINFTKDYVFYTVQGEGRFVGTPSVFIRLSGCNLRCSWKNMDGSIALCDTAYSSHFPENNMHSLEECVQEVLKYPCHHIVITGGEPFMQLALVPLIAELKKHNKIISIETNASIYLDTDADLISMSPKLKSSCHQESKFYEEHHSQRKNLEVIQSFIRQHDFQIKFVVNHLEDMPEIDAYYVEILKICENLFQDQSFCENLAIDHENQNSLLAKDFLDSRMYLMPQALTVKQLDEKSVFIIEECKKRNWNFADRMHLRVWGPKRGV